MKIPSCGRGGVIDYYETVYRDADYEAYVGAMMDGRAEDALQRAHDTLEKEVEDRTADLSLTNEKLGREIEKRKLRISREKRLIERAEAHFIKVMTFSVNGTEVARARSRVARSWMDPNLKRGNRR